MPANKLDDQTALCIDEVLNLLGQGRTDLEIRQTLERQHGCPPRQAAQILKRARLQAVAMLNQPAVQHKAISYLTYLSIVRDKTVGTLTRLKAQQAIDRLLGLEGPTFGITDSQGSDLSAQYQLPAPSIEEAAVLLKMMDEAGLLPDSLNERIRGHLPAPDSESDNGRDRDNGPNWEAMPTEPA